MTLHVAKTELARRKRAWKAPKARITRVAYLAKYAKQVSSASTGAVTDLVKAHLFRPGFGPAISGQYQSDRKNPSKWIGSGGVIV